MTNSTQVNIRQPEIESIWDSTDSKLIGIKITQQTKLERMKFSLWKWKSFDEVKSVQLKHGILTLNWHSN